MLKIETKSNTLKTPSNQSQDVKEQKKSIDLDIQSIISSIRANAILVKYKDKTSPHKISASEGINITPVTSAKKIIQQIDDLVKSNLTKDQKIIALKQFEVEMEKLIKG